MQCRHFRTCGVFHIERGRYMNLPCMYGVGILSKIYTWESQEIRLEKAQLDSKSAGDAKM